jgi:phosphatidylethanolamine/phosphatidyl-N-methylethanolamine N-methyltransferase
VQTPMSKRGGGLARAREVVTFAEAFLRHPQSVGTMIPSSWLVERRLVEWGDVKSARLVVELGPGTGGTTRALLSAMRPDSTLLCIERHPGFAAALRDLDDPRLVVHLGSADGLIDALAAHGLGAADLVVSGVPFSTMPISTATRTMEGIHSALSSDGCFLAYQIRNTVAEVARPLFGAPDVTSVLLNVPPLRIFRWRASSGRVRVASSDARASARIQAHLHPPTNSGRPDTREQLGSATNRVGAGPTEADRRLAGGRRRAGGRGGLSRGGLARMTWFSAMLAISTLWPGLAWGQNDLLVRVSLEGAVLWQTRNDVQIPPASGTRFSITDLVGTAPTRIARAEATTRVGRHHGLRVVYAPLRVVGRGVPISDIAFAGSCVFRSIVSTHSVST